MEAYTPPYQLTNEILSAVAAISEKVGKISEGNYLTPKPHLRRNSMIQSIHSSLCIEANSLSLDQVRDVIDGHIVLGAAREIQEVKNAYAAYEALGTFDPFSIAELKRLHGIMTAYLVQESGAFRSGEEGVFDGERCIFMAPPARLVAGEIEKLFAWMKNNRGKIHPLIMAAVFHYEFVFIHPFTDGNGRMARLWHTALLMQWKPIFQYIPLESQIEKFQEDYYRVISACHSAGSSTQFIVFMLEKLDAILDDILMQTGANSGSIEMTRYMKRLLEVMEQDVPYTATEILGLLELKSKETLQKNYLKPAIKAGLVEMTHPEKPRSRNQQYILRK